ncbi:MAG: polyprenyl synthetase family protein [Acetivibrionales bacterium]
MEAFKYNPGRGVRIPEIDLKNARYMDEVESELLQVISGSSGAIYEMCMHILKAGGKRLRPLLVIQSGLVFGSISKQLVKAAAAAELIHMASLVHDDIIDKSDMRRGKISVNKKWGNHFSVLCGDYLFAQAFSTLSANNLVPGLKLMLEAIQDMCHGEILQADGRFKTDTSIKEYYEKIAKKTAIFIGRCCESGAAVCGADALYLKALGDYGLNLGYAFQIVDDVLDLCGNTDVMGKPKMEDLRLGNLTLPLILLLRSGKYGRWLKEIIDSRNFTNEELNRIPYALKDSGVLEESLGIASMHAEKAKACLKLFPESESINFLCNLSEMLKFRVN